MPKPTVPEVSPLVKLLYSTPQGGVGCCLHIVLDDQNVADGDVDFCIQCAKEKGHPECLELALLLRRMSKTQRLKLSRIR